MEQKEKELEFTNRFQLIPAAILIACTALMGAVIVFCEKAFGNNSRSVLSLAAAAVTIFLFSMDFRWLRQKTRELSGATALKNVRFHRNDLAVFFMNGGVMAVFILISYILRSK